MIHRSLIACLFCFQASVSIAQQASTEAATQVSLSSATLNGRATATTAPLNVSFEWGTTTTYGNTQSGNPGTVQPGTPVPFNGGLTGLNPSTTYHYRAVATNTAGTFYGSDLSFTTPASSVPTVGSNGKVYGRGDLFATFYADINPNNSPTTVKLQYGTTTSYGLSGDVTPATIPAGLYFVSVSARIANLLPDMVYHYRWSCGNGSGVTNTNDRIINTSGVGVNSIFGSEFRIYPNPVKDLVMLELPGLADDYQIRITDVTGRYVTVPAMTIGQKAELDFSKLASGAYAVTVSGKGQRYSQILNKK